MIAAFMVGASAPIVQDLGVADPALDAKLKAAKLAFDEEFNTLSLYDRTARTGVWSTEFGYGGPDSHASRDGAQAAYTRPDLQGDRRDRSARHPFSIDKGVLSITAAPATGDMAGQIWEKTYTSGVLTTKTSFSQQYGFFDVRAKLPKGAGMWPAFWLLPADGSWPPEIDIFEQLSKDPNTLYLTGHTKQDGTHQQTQAVISCPGRQRRLP